MHLKRIFILFIVFFLSLSIVPANTEQELNNDSCTSIIVGKSASKDGSVMTAHTCDANYRTWVEFVPAGNHKKGEMVDIVKGSMHNFFAGDKRIIKKLGEIPQVEKTFRYFYTAYPAMNEHQLAIGETTFGGRRELRSKRGIFQVEELQRMVLERCKTAREAIKLIGKLVKKYGYCDSGECLTIIDKKEAWMIEIMGPGKGKLGGVWVAARIPDDHVGISANICRIAEIDLNNPDYYMASKNVFKLAKKKGWWDPKKEKFKFYKAYGSSYSGKPFSIREFWVFNTLAPSLKLNFKAEELPFSVKPDKKVSLDDMIQLYKATYTGSEYDMTKNLIVKQKNRKTKEVKEIKSPVANPWMSRHLRTLLNTLKKDIVKRHRPIAVEYCAYHTVLQSRDWLPNEIGGRIWFGLDNPAMTVKAPLYMGMKSLLPSYKIGAQERFRRDSAAWAFRRVAKLSMIRWDRCKKPVQAVMKEFEDKAYRELPQLEKTVAEIYKKDKKAATEMLTQYVHQFCGALINRYWDLGDKLWNFYARGF
jgi:dipeptidase